MKRLFVFLALGVFVVLFCPAALAQSAGYDLLQTGSNASVDLTSMNLGVVPLQGQQIQSNLGNTDTIMQRTANGPGQVPVDVYALFMKSQNPVTFQNQSCDVYVTINNSGGKISTSVLPQPDHLSGSSGNVTIRTDGTFDSSFTVNADLIFVQAGQPVTNTAKWVGHSTAPSVPMSSTNSSWSSSAPSGYPSNPNYPSGGFYPKPVHTGPHPVVPAKCGSGGLSSQKQAGKNDAIAVATCIAATN